MTVKECIKKNGWNVQENPQKAWNVDIGFINSETELEDETEFSICAYDEDDLQDLFEEFCKENKISSDTVIYVSVIQTANDFEELN